MMRFHFIRTETRNRISTGNEWRLRAIPPEALYTESDFTSLPFCVCFVILFCFVFFNVKVESLTPRRSRDGTRESAHFAARSLQFLRCFRSARRDDDWRVPDDIWKFTAIFRQNVVCFVPKEANTRKSRRSGRWTIPKKKNSVEINSPAGLDLVFLFCFIVVLPKGKEMEKKKEIDRQIKERGKREKNNWIELKLDSSSLFLPSTHVKRRDFRTE